MAILGSSSRSEPRTGALYDPIRKEWVADLPEERIRQALVQHMVEALGYPASLMAVEKALSQMPHLARHPGRLPLRRADVVSFAVGIHPHHSIFPLLLVECKALSLGQKAVDQVIGYNHFLGAPFVALADHQRVVTGFKDGKSGQWRFQEGLPAYEALKALLSETGLG